MTDTEPTLILDALGPRPLFVTPHPGDESHAFGGLLTVLAAHRIEAHFLCVTAVAESTHHDELVAAWETLGHKAATLTCGALPEGHLDTATVMARLKASIADRLLFLAPTAILVLGPEGIYGHRDYVAVWEAVAELVPKRDVTHAVRTIVWPLYPDAERLFAPLRGHLARTAPDLLSRRTGSPRSQDIEVTVPLSPTAAATKYRAIAAHRSQLPEGDADNFLGRGVVRVLCEAEHFAIHRIGEATTLLTPPARDNG